MLRIEIGSVIHTTRTLRKTIFSDFKIYNATVIVENKQTLKRLFWMFLALLGTYINLLLIGMCNIII